MVGGAFYRIKPIRIYGFFKKKKEIKKTKIEFIFLSVSQTV